MHHRSDMQSSRRRRGASLVAAMVLLTPSQLCAASADSIFRFAGKFHPLIVHFPIALLLLAAAFEFLRSRRNRAAGPSDSARLMLAVGALGAAVAALLGWADALTAGHTGTDAGVLWAHRWIGILTAAVAALGALLSLSPRLSPRRPPASVPSSRSGVPRTLTAYRLSLILSALLVALSGHLGASLIYGTDYIARAFDHLNAAPAPATVLVAGGTKIDFTRDIQPILDRRCFQCHTGDHPESGLRLDDRALALKGGNSGKPAIVPGNAPASRLIRMISGEEPGKLMPPKGGALDCTQIEALAAWISQGAPYTQHAPGEHWHWAYRPPVRPNPPPVKDTFWPRNPIDSFVLARLESGGLKPSREATPEALIRRVSLDLTGLPPTLEEIDAYLADLASGRPDAYERVVDRLLASPRYGERWARVWLDLARYADTHGYEKDERRTMWAYRDWVIDALNRDMPFDQFTTAQLAGDLLPDPSIDDLIATGFNRNTMINEEGGVDAEEFRCDSIVDRVNTMSAVWLGSTLQCAQCHNHKNDPFTQEEYYRLFAFFNGDDSDVVLHSTGAAAAGAMVEVVPPARRAQLAALRTEIAALERELVADTESLAAEQAAWEEDFARTEPAWTILAPGGAAAAPADNGDGATLNIEPDGSVLVYGAAPDRDTYTLDIPAPTALSSITAIRLEALPDPKTNFVGRTGHGNFVLSEITIVPSGDGAPAAFSTALADYEQPAHGNDSGFPAKGAVDNDPRTGWAVEGQNSRPHTALFGLASPIPAGPLKVTLAQDYGGRHTLAHFRLSATSDPRPLTRPPLPKPIADTLAVTPDSRSDEQRRELADYFRVIAPSLKPARERLAALRKEVEAMRIGTTSIMHQQQEARDTFIHIRGNFLDHGKQVSPGVPAVLHKLTLPDGERPTRMTLANWINDPANPLTARVTVNRAWEHLFGRGLVETSDDFGTQGEPPSHPELLDWLATELPRQNWSMKALYRLIVTSATYRQDSAIAPGLLELDPHNKLLARGPRFRLEAEMIRDVALAAGGLLSPKIGGPSVFPPQPEGVWTMIYNDDKWIQSKGEDRYRRAVYTFWRRTAPYPTFVTFDAPSREITCTRRPRTDTPLQALTTLNDPQFVEAAAALARRTMREAGEQSTRESPPDPRTRLVHAFRLCLARPPTDAEIDRLLRLYEEQLAAYRADPDAARALLASSQPPDTPPPDPTLDPAELAAWTIIANVLLNLDETLTKG